MKLMSTFCPSIHEIGMVALVTKHLNLHLSQTLQDPVTHLNSSTNYCKFLDFINGQKLVSLTLATTVFATVPATIPITPTTSMTTC